MANYPTTLDNDGSLLVAANFVRSTVASDMSNVQNTIPLADASTFPDPAGATYYVVIDAATSSLREICGYTGKSANTLTGVTRGQRGTSNFAHLTGVLVEQNIIDAYHEFVKAALIAVETKSGIDGSATTTTFDYKLSEITGGDKSAGKTASQTLTNKTLTAPTINGGTATALTNFAIRDTSAAFDVTLVATSSPVLSAGRIMTWDMGNVAHSVVWGTTTNTITFPNGGSDTVVMRTATQTLTNKTLTAPTITATDWTNANHAHDAANTAGRLLTLPALSDAWVYLP